MKLLLLMNNDIFKRITQWNCYSYRFHIRFNQFDAIHHIIRLFQEFIVDVYVQIEQKWLQFIHFNQKKLCVDLYQSFTDMIIHDANFNNIDSFKILSFTFVDNFRQMWQLYHNVIIIIHSYDKSNLFIIITYNFQWIELFSTTFSDQTAQDRFELIVRLFKLKLNVLLYEFIDLHVFNNVVVYVYTIEFQKRNLSHVHILLIFEQKRKFWMSDIIDHMICAEISDKNVYFELYEIIVSYILHESCEKFKSTSFCMINEKYNKKYLKTYIDQILINEDEYSLYWWQNDDIIVFKNKYEFNNHDIISYNKYFFVRYNCHINVKIITFISTIKYFYKYVYKDHDRTFISIERNENEIIDEFKKYLNAHYMSSLKICWKIFRFSLHHHQLYVIKLQFHLLNE